MGKKKKLVTLISILVSAVLLTVYWSYHHKIVDGDFDKLTISGMEGETIQVIEDKDEIAKILRDINESPRTFKYDYNGSTYDYLQHGILTFENKTEKVQIGFLLNNGKSITKYWEIDTEYLFGE
jgi:hypothetical protein